MQRELQNPERDKIKRRIFGALIGPGEYFKLTAAAFHAAMIIFAIAGLSGINRGNANRRAAKARVEIDDVAARADSRGRESGAGELVPIFVHASSDNSSNL